MTKCSTLYRQELKHCVDEKMKQPDWVYILPQVAASLNEGVYPQSYIDVLAQKWERYPYDIYDAYGILQVDTDISRGRFAVFQIPIGQEPVADKAIEKQNELLSFLQPPFSAKFLGGTQGADGELILEKPVNALLVDPRQSGIRGFVIVPPGRFPLEVGYNDISKTWMYLNIECGVARWPYWQDRITVITPCFVSSFHPSFQEHFKNVYGCFDALPIPWDDGTWNFPEGNLIDACGIDSKVLDLFIEMSQDKNDK